MVDKVIKQVPHQGGLRETEVVDYIITIDMAKELAMVEANDQGKTARKYFIACEKEMKRLQAENTKLLEDKLAHTLDLYSTTTYRLKQAQEDVGHLRKIVDDIPVTRKSERKDVEDKGIVKGIKDYRKIVAAPKARDILKTASNMKKDLTALVKYEVITEGTKQGLEQHICKIESCADTLLVGFEGEQD